MLCGYDDHGRDYAVQLSDPSRPGVQICALTTTDCTAVASPAMGRQTFKSSWTTAVSLTLSPMLSDEDRAILDFERTAWREPGPKDQAIEIVLGLNAADYYERLRDLVLGVAALAYDPLTTKRVLTIIEEPRETGLAVS